MSERRSILGLVLVLLLAGAPAETSAALPEGIDRSFPVTTGVSSMAIAGDTLFVAGNFGWIGAPNGQAVALDAATGAAVESWPRIHMRKYDNFFYTSLVHASLPDGDGGCFVGGTFTTFSGIPRSNLVHIRGDGTVDGWNPIVSGGAVRQIIRIGETLYIAGYFTSVGGQPRNRLAAVDATTGSVLPWDPGAGAGFIFIESMVTNGLRIYVAGTFTSIGGQFRSGAAALDPVTGNATVWNPSPNSDIWTLAVAGDVVYAGGRFTNIGGQARMSLAQLDGWDGSATAWNVNMNSGSMVTSIAVRGSTLYVGGAFSQIGGAARNGLAAVDLPTAIATAWQPPMTSSGTRAIATDDSRIYLGGWFFRDGNGLTTPPCALLAVDPVTGTTTHWTGGADQPVMTLAVSGSRVFATGSFAGCGAIRQQRLAAIDLNTSRLLPWQPAVNGWVSCVTAAGPRIVAGGSFTMIDGQSRGGLAAFDRGLGSLASWNPSQGVANRVDRMAANDDKVFVSNPYPGGSFGGSPLQKLAALDLATGALLPWNPTHDGTTNGLIATPTRVYLLGEFNVVNGVTRRGLAAVDTDTGALQSWDAQLTRSGAIYINAAAIGGSSLYFTGVFEKVGGVVRSGLAAVDTGTAFATAWAPQGFATDALAVAGSDVLIGWMGGHYLDPGVGWNSLLGFDATTGAMRPWYPRVAGFYGPSYGGVYVIATRGEDVIAGGPYDLFAGEVARPGLVRLRPLDVTAPIAAVQSPAGGESIVIGSLLEVRWTASDDQAIQSADVYLSRSGPSGPWELLAAAITDRSSYDWTVTPNSSNDCWLRVDIRDDAGHATTAYSAAAFGIAHTTDAPPEVASSRLGLEAPNPMRESAPVALFLPQAENARLTLVDVQGREVKVLLDASLPAGRHTAPLSLAGVAPGLYFLRLRVPTGEIVHRLAVMR